MDQKVFLISQEIALKSTEQIVPYMFLIASTVMLKLNIRYKTASGRSLAILEGRRVNGVFQKIMEYLNLTFYRLLQILSIATFNCTYQPNMYLETLSFCVKKIKIASLFKIQHYSMLRQQNLKVNLKKSKKKKLIFI